MIGHSVYAQYSYRVVVLVLVLLPTKKCGGWTNNKLSLLTRNLLPNAGNSDLLNDSRRLSSRFQETGAPNACAQSKHSLVHVLFQLNPPLSRHGGTQLGTETIKFAEHDEIHLV